VLALLATRPLWQPRHAMSGQRAASNVADEVAAKGASAQTSDGPQAQTAPAASIAVLPFADLSQERNQQYFSDGVAEEILNVLAKVDGLKVASRTSSFQFRNKDIGTPLIALVAFAVAKNSLLADALIKALEEESSEARLEKSGAPQRASGQQNHFERVSNTTNRARPAGHGL